MLTINFSFHRDKPVSRPLTCYARNEIECCTTMFLSSSHGLPGHGFVYERDDTRVHCFSSTSNLLRPLLRVQSMPRVSYYTFFHSRRMKLFPRVLLSFELHKIMI